MPPPSSARRQRGRRKGGASGRKVVCNISLARSVQSRNYAFAKPGIVTAGKYTSTIVEVKPAKTKAGAEAVDVLYDLENSARKQFHVLMRYPRESEHFYTLVDALLAAGLSADDDIADAVGIREKIVIEYVDGATIGSITERSPIGKKAIKTKMMEIEEDADDDSEFDDFLEDIDNEEEDD